MARRTEGVANLHHASGVVQPRLQKALSDLVTPVQMQRIQDALAPLMHARPATLDTTPSSVH